MRHTRTTIFAAVIVSLLAAGPASAQVQPGDKITAANKDIIAGTPDQGIIAILGNIKQRIILDADIHNNVIKVRIP